jgi:O-antigen/teichoic acid export membrane protein
LRLIINNASNAILVVLFFFVGWVDLASLALAIVLSASLGLLYLVVVVFRLQEGLSVGLRYIRLAIFKELMGFSLWNMLLQLSGFFILYTNPLIIGRYMGPKMVPYYAIPFMLIMGLQDGVMGLSGTLIPLASSTLATGDINLMRQLLRKGTYVASMLVFPLGGVLLVMCKNLFRVWLPAGYEDSWVIYGILMIAFFGATSQSVSFFLMLGGGNIRPMAVFYLLAGIITVALSIYLVGYTNLGLIGAALAIVIPRFVSTNLFLPWYACQQVGLNLWRYIRDSYTRPILCSVPSVVLGAFLVNLFPPANLVYWVIEFVVALIPFAIFALTGVLDWPLRRDIVQLLHRCVLGIVKR